MNKITCLNRRELEMVANNFNITKMYGKIVSGTQTWTVFFN